MAAALVAGQLVSTALFAARGSARLARLRGPLWIGAAASIAFAAAGVVAAASRSARPFLAGAELAVAAGAVVAIRKLARGR
jgi:hypothetical protein